MDGIELTDTEIGAAHSKGEIALAASYYLHAAEYLVKGTTIDEIEDAFYFDDESWPWHDVKFKPSSRPVDNLAKAAALIAAEIFRLQRLENKTP